MDESNDDDFLVDFDRHWAVMESPRKWSQLFQRIDGIGVIDLVGRPLEPDLPYHRVLIYLIIWLAVKDRASALDFQFDATPSLDEEAASNSKLKIGYVVDEAYYDLGPPRSESWPCMALEFKDLAGLSSPRHHLAAWLHRLAGKIDGQPQPYWTGRFQLRIDDDTLEVELTVFPSDQGERFYLALPAISASVADRVWASRSRFFKSCEPVDHVETPKAHSSGPETT